MTAAHIVLMLTAMLMAGEALWAIASPAGMRDRVRRLLDEAGTAMGAWRYFFWVLALLSWLFAWLGQQWAHRSLFFIGVFFMWVGFLAHRPTFLESWYALFLGRRSNFAIRLIYLGELLLAAVFLWIAVRGV